MLVSTGQESWQTVKTVKVNLGTYQKFWNFVEDSYRLLRKNFDNLSFWSRHIAIFLDKVKKAIGLGLSFGCQKCWNFRAKLSLQAKLNLQAKVNFRVTERFRIALLLLEIIYAFKLDLSASILCLNKNYKNWTKHWKNIYNQSKLKIEYFHKFNIKYLFQICPLKTSQNNT